MNYQHQNFYLEVRNVIKWLRAEALRYAELVLCGDQEKFALLRKYLLQLYGEAWGAEKRIKDIFALDRPQNGQAGQKLKLEESEDDPMSG